MRKTEEKSKSKQDMTSQLSGGRDVGEARSRRTFIQAGIAAFGALLALGSGQITLLKIALGATRKDQLNIGYDAPPHPPLVPSDPAVRVGVPGRKWVMIIDLAKCDGCKRCTADCNTSHFVPQGNAWIKVFKMKDAQHTAGYWFPRPCYHCDEPPCTKVCPVDATFKRNDGVVLIDNTRCIGCRYCMAACPYSVREFNWGTRPKNWDIPPKEGPIPPAAVAPGTPPPSAPAEPDVEAMHTYSPETGFPRVRGTVEKCDFCPDLAAKGILPICCTSCVMGAIYFGDENEDAVTNFKGETERFRNLLLKRAGYRQLEELGTKPRVYYLPPKERIYPGPKEI